MAILASPFDLPRGRLLALDLGSVRIGVAVCDEAGMLATPLGVLRRHPTRAQDYAEIAALVERERVAGVLVGLPMNDTDGGQARWVRRYTGRLAAVLSVPVAFWDETLSTADAQALLAESAGRTAVDAVAAAVLLNEFLQARAARDGQPEFR